MDDAAIRVIIFSAMMLIMAVAEYLVPRRVLSLGYQRWRTNIGILVLNILLVRMLMPAGAIGAAWWAQEHAVGLLPLLNLPEMVMVAVAVVFLDALIYGQHVLFHAVPLLWRLHMVHHADRDIDVSTGLRFHPIEIILSMLIKMAAVVLLGAPVLAVMIFEVLLNSMAMFNHANVRLPLKWDALLRLLVITPDVHRIHHSIIPNETNSNYGFNLSIWDRLFGTYRAQPKHGHDGMVIGLKHLQNAPTHRFLFILRLPFSNNIGQYPSMQKNRDNHKRG